MIRRIYHAVRYLYWLAIHMKDSHRIAKYSVKYQQKGRVK